jgi:hypothetical protein
MAMGLGGVPGLAFFERATELDQQRQTSGVGSQHRWLDAFAFLSFQGRFTA